MTRPEPTRAARVAVIRSMADWGAIAHDLAHLPVVYDAEIAEVLGVENGWRGATPDETDRIVQVVTAHLRAYPETLADDEAS